MHRRYFWLFTMQTFRKLMVSNALAMLLPLVISLVLYGWVAGVIELQIERTNQGSLQQLNRLMDEKFRSISIVSDQLSLNEDLRTVAGMKGPVTAEQRMNMYDVQAYLTQIKSSNSFIESIYVWFPNNGYVLSNTTRISPTETNRLLSTSFGSSMQEWIDIVTPVGYRNLSLIALQGSKTKDSFLFSQKVYINDYLNESAIIAITGSRNAVKETLDLLRWGQESVLLLTDSNGTVLSQPAGSEVAEAISDGSFAVPTWREATGGLLTEGSTSKVAKTRINGREYFHASRPSAWQLVYTYLIPSDIYMKDAEAVRNTVILYVLLSLVFGLVLSWYLAKRNYSPIAKLTQTYLERLDQREWSGKEDISFLSDSLQKLLQKNDSLERTLYTQKNFVKNDMLNMLIRGRTAEWKDAAARCREAGIELLSDRCMLLGVVVNDESTPFFESSSEDNGENELLVKYMLISVLEELIGAHHRAYYLGWEGFNLCFISLAVPQEQPLNATDSPSASSSSRVSGSYPLEEKEAAVREIRGIVDQIRALFTEKFGIYLSVAISLPVDQLKDLPVALGEVTEMVEAMGLHAGKGMVMTHSDMRRVTMEESFGSTRSFLAIQRQVADLFSHGDIPGASYAVAQYIDTDLSDIHLPFQTVKLRMAGLINFLLDLVAEMRQTGTETLWESMRPVERLAQVRNLPELKVVIADILRDVTAMAEKQKEESSVLRISSVRDSVDARIYDPNLSVSVIAEEFHVSLPYLSRVFKRDNGIGLLEYIHNKRVLEAKRLLSTTSMNVQEVAEKVGYGSRVTLTRAFKRYEGTSPGDCRMKNEA